MDENLPRWIVADTMRLRQILTNLLNNSVKFTEAGFVRLSVQEQGAGLVITAADSGRGIAPERLGTVFESFAQESETTHQQFGGTGLGLSISRSLAELMGGSLSVESEPGVGSTVSLRLLLKLAESATNMAPGEERKEPSIGFGGRILVAEDHPVNQLLVSAMLDKIGIEFELVGDGAAAFDAAVKADEAARPYKLVLMN